jgi:hypothetical protein
VHGCLGTLPCLRPELVHVRTCCVSARRSGWRRFDVHDPIGAPTNFRWSRLRFSRTLHARGSGGPRRSAPPESQARVGGSNPVAPTKTPSNPHKQHETQGFKAQALRNVVRHQSPSTAIFCIGLGPNLGPQESQLSDANAGGCWKAAVGSGPTWPLTAREGGFPESIVVFGLPRGSCAAAEAGGVYGLRSSLD